MAQLSAPADDHLHQESLRGHAGDKDATGGDLAAGESADVSSKRARAGLCGVLRERKVAELASGRRLVEVPYTATLAHTANALLAAGVSAVAVAAPPGHWIGAGGSMILESDPATGAVRKHYIGMVNMLDILAHIADAGDDGDGGEGVDDIDRRMAVPVSSVIGHSLEGLTLWTLHPNTSLLDCMETFSKGVHRALVPVESSADDNVVVAAVELVESSPGYRMLTQMDVIRFLHAHAHDAELRHAMSRPIRHAAAAGADAAVFAVSSTTKVFDAVRAMRAASLAAVPVVSGAADAGGGEILVDGRGKRVEETFSATDLRDCHVSELRSWLGISVAEFKENVAAARRRCTVGEVIEKAVGRHVHRVWVVDEEGLLAGVVSLTDLIRVVREAAIGEEMELHGIDAAA
uniref:CBS domain-containing protein n=1 Tax=Leersia perrieri TaxID=77586 RepID=A0A0D9VCF1_9ORYZ